MFSDFFYFMNILYTFTKKYPAIMILTTNFNRLPVTNPINDHRADLNAWLCSFPAYFSPRYDPRNGPAIRPMSPNGPIVIQSKGRIITAITSQILLPRTPRLVQPNFLVPREGTT
jgi:hypothetical protein